MNEKATEASCLVNCHIYQRVEAYSIAENLMKHCTVEMVKFVLDETINKINRENPTV